MTKKELIRTLEWCDTQCWDIPAASVARFTKYALEECELAKDEDREPDYSTAISCIHRGDS